MEPETATAIPRSPLSVTVKARQHELIQDKPSGDDAGMMASELLMASLLSCQHSTFVKVAAKRKADVSIASIDAEMHFDDKDDIERIDLHFHLEGGDEKTRDTLLRLTDKICTISRALSCPVNVAHSD